MSQVEKVALTLNNIALTLNHFNNGCTVVVIGYKQTELYNVKLHSKDMLLNALHNAVLVRLI